MMQTPIVIRPATPTDMAAVDALLARSYPRLLAADYPPSVLVTAVPIIARARPELLASGRYFVALAGRVAVGAGGYSLAAPGARGGPEGASEAGTAHIRHVATDPDHLRRGIARALMARIFAAAAAEGAVRFDCLSTRTAVPFYASVGFAVLGEVEVPLAPGIGFPAVRMIRQ
jgi:GNAT superfamily N-acetyltransferase